jgi:EF hand
VVVAGAVAILVPLGQSPTISVVDQSSGCLGENRDLRINFTRAELMGRGCMFSEEVRNVRVLGLTISALILAYGAVGAIAQDRMTQQPDQQQMQSHPMGQEDTGTMGQGGMMGRGMMGGHMTGRGMMGGGAMGPPIMFRMMFALMDADSDGTISLQEFQAAHERIFKAMDSNKDGKLTLEEMQAFMHGTR